MRSLTTLSTLSTLFAVVLAIATSAPSPATAQQAASATATVQSGSISGRGGHKARGTVRLVRAGGRYKVVFAKNFWLDGAPDPRVAFGNGRYVPGTQIASLRRRTGSQSYTVPAGINVARFTQIWIWCRKFNSPIAVATIR